MRKFKFISFFLFCALAICLAACSDDNSIPTPEPEPEPEPPVTNYQDGYNYSVKALDADKPITITFKAPAGTALYGSTGDMYLYSGVGADWEGAPSSWTDNNAKYKMTAVKGESNLWSITLSPSIRSFYGVSESTVVQLLNLIVRNATGDKQTGDYTTLVQDSKHSFILTEVEKQSSPVTEEGIYVNSPTSVTVMLYDYSTAGVHKDYAFVTGDFCDWKLDNKYQMNYDESKHCWWITLSNLTPGERAFQYFVYSNADGGTYLGDPYSEKVLEKDVDNNFPAKAFGQYVSVVNTQPAIYNWTVTDFKMGHSESLVIYELLLRDFTSTHNLEGAKAKLPYLKGMGVNAIELMPVQEFDGADSWGYNPSYFFALDNSYGNQKQYKEFIDACHKEGIAVIFDVVYNHGTNNMPFAKMYWDCYNNKVSKSSPYFNVDAPHPYSVFNDFNHDSEQVRKYIKRNLQFLLKEYKIDGFRFDLTKGFTQNQTTESTASKKDAKRIAILKDYNAAIKEVKSDAYVILEHFCEIDEEKELAADGMHLWRNMNSAYCQSAMGWKENPSSDFSGLYETTYAWVGFMESHDEERTAYKQTAYGNASLQTNLTDRMSQLSANAAFFFTVPGPKMVWQFGEMGYDVSIDENGRTGKKPLHWEYLDNKDRKVLQTTYSKLIKLRNDNPELFTENTDFSWQVGISNWDKGRFIISSSATKKMVVVGNFTATDSEYTVTFPTTGTWYNYLSAEAMQVSEATRKIKIPAYTALVFTTFQ